MLSIPSRLTTVMSFWEHLPLIWLRKELNLSEFSPKIKDKTFVVSGGAGFLGSWFSDAAIRMGGRVVCVDNLIAGSQKSILHLKDHPNFQFVEEDITEFSRVSPDFSH